MSSRQSRSLIRSHHTLRKQLKDASSKNEVERSNELQAKIEAAGGLHRYQEASIQGQSLERGGDSSKILVEWLTTPIESSLKNKPDNAALKLLEVGALRPDNACARSKMFNFERIDLRSQHPSIREQDFMERPVPSSARLGNEGFDIISLSLVLNFVDNATARGEMLKRVSSFLRQPQQIYENHNDFVPCLFLVLPAPCVDNSRYLDTRTLENIMNFLGYEEVRSKTSAKLVYHLWKLNREMKTPECKFKKEVVRSGKNRNNFSIVLS